jgi:hypothetical protein
MVNKPMEGAVLVILTPVRGISGADLAGFAGLLMAAYSGAQVYRRRVGT